MAYESMLDRACEEIEKARDAVIDASQNLRAAEALMPSNAANRRLADAHARYQEILGGLVPDDR